MSIFAHPLRFKTRSLLTATALALALCAQSARAQSIPIANPSFESPAQNNDGLPVNVTVDGWTDTEQRPGYESPVPWGFGTGTFPNPPAGQQGHYARMDGSRAAYILTSKDLGFYQQLTAPEGIFTVGEAYQLTVGVAAQGGTPEGTILSISLYYTQGSVRIPVATTQVPTFPDTDTFTDFTVNVPVVQAGDAWAGKAMGILLQITNVPPITSGPQAGQPNEAGGFDIDLVRLNVVPEPSSALLFGLGAALVARRRRRGA